VTYGVVTICRNAAETIERCLRSVFAQDVVPAQYIVVDGGSTDGTVATVRQVAESAPPGCDLRIVNQPPPADGVAGIPNAWNLGLRELRTDVVALLNADDWWEPTTATVVHAQFASQPGLDLLVSPIRIVGEDSEWTLRPRPLWLLPFLMPVMHPGCFVRGRVYDQVGTFDERYRISADYDFIYRCRRAGMSFGSYPTPLVNMQWGGAARQNLGTARRETLAIARRHCRVPGLPHVAYLLRKMLGR
jgi:glycosyltransferase involved in cell wall biosynthesis